MSNIQRCFSKWRSPEQPHFQCSSTALAQRYFSPRKITKPQPHITWNPAVDLSLGETKTHNMCLEARRGLRIFFLRWKWNNACGHAVNWLWSTVNLWLHNFYNMRRMERPVLESRMGEGEWQHPLEYKENGKIIPLVTLTPENSAVQSLAQGHFDLLTCGSRRSSKTLW